MATINGTSSNDTLSGTSGDDTINGLGGNDLFLAGSTGGNDVIDGGTGFDSLEFRERATSAIVVDFVAGTISGGSSGTISFTNVERVIGGNFDDIMTGNAASQTLTGRFGADTLWGAGGVDTLWGGGDGNTFVFRETGTANADRINDFASGSDKILLDASVMSALGASGNFAAGDDRFVLNSAQDAEDRIVFNTTTKQVFYDADGSGSGAAVLIATLQSSATLVATDIVVEGDDTPPGGGQTINGTPGDDDLVSGPDDDTINGFGGNDTISMVDEPSDASDNPGNDVIDGGDGIDWVVFSSGGSTDAVIVDLAAGTYSTSDSASGTLTNIENVAGSLYDDELTGNDGPNWLSGGEGSDTVDGRGGNDTLWGAGGADRVNGGDGSDELLGGAGDTLDGGFGDDLYRVGSGNSILPDPGGVDSVVAMDTDWTLAAGLENLRITHDDFGGSPHTAIGNDLNNTIHGGEFGGTLRGMGGNDLLVPYSGGSPGNYVVQGGDGDDTLHAGLNNDTLSGDAGNDVLIDQWMGNKWLTGGAGADRFLFQWADNTDTITDFLSASDRIVLDGNTYASSGPSGTFAAGDARFWSSTTGMAHDADDRVIYDTDSGELWYDADGDAGGGRLLIATLQGTPPPTLAATDIEIINGSTPPPPPPDEGEVINGTSGNDTLDGTAGDDTIDGLAGNDLVRGNEGADSLRGGDGNDTMWGYFNDTHFRDFAADTLDGGFGDDVYHVDGTDGDVILSDPGGTDTVFAWRSHWTLGPGLEHLTLEDDVGSSSHGTGNELDNRIVSATEGGTLLGLGGNDTLDASGNAENTIFLHGGDGDDTLLGSGGDDQLFGDAGNDLLAGKGRFSTMTGGAGADVFYFDTHPDPGVSPDDSAQTTDFATSTDTIRLDANAMPALGASGRFSTGDARFAQNSTGTAQDLSDRVIYNTSNGELWYDENGSSAGGAALIVTLQGAPTLAPADIEVVNGTAPPPGNVINGTSGNDTLSATAGNDTINGLGGNDLFLAGTPLGNNLIDGGTGHDTIEFRDRATTPLVIDFRGETGEITDWPQSDHEIAFTNVERVIAGNFDDTLTGNAASQTLVGRFGADTLWGGGGVDTLWGGGDGNTFVFREVGTANADRISDWASGVDTLALDNRPEAMSALGEGDFVTNDPRFASGAGFTSGRDPSDRVVFDTSTGRLYYDADGNGSGAAQLIATVQSGASVAASDIVVI